MKNCFKRITLPLLMLPLLQGCGGPSQGHHRSNLASFTVSGMDPSFDHIDIRLVEAKTQKLIDHRVSPGDLSQKDYKIHVHSGSYLFEANVFEKGALTYSSSYCDRQTYPKVYAPKELVPGHNKVEMIVCDQTNEKPPLVVTPVVEESTVDIEIKKISDAKVYVRDRKLVVNDKPYFIKGVCWNPVPKDKKDNDVMFNDVETYRSAIDQDIHLMKEAGINTLRTYVPLTSIEVLDKLHANGIKVIIPFLGDAHPDHIRGVVQKIKDHDAILMYELGNEWNYNKLYTNYLDHNQALKKIKASSELIKSLDNSRPISSSYGNLPPKEVIDELNNIDLWGINRYSGLSFDSIFNEWKNISDKPIYMSEFGADAFNNDKNVVDLEAQAQATRRLLSEIVREASHLGEGPLVGGTIFEWSDEWWKDKDPKNQDNGGVAPGGGPHPDMVFNEEWWGIVSIERETRPAYDVLKEFYRRH